MYLSEVVKRYGGTIEQELRGRIAEGKQIDLSRLTEVLDSWSRTWNRLNPMTVDHRRRKEQRDLDRDLRRFSQALNNMTFGLRIQPGHTKQFIRSYLLNFYPAHKPLIDELFRQSSWWLPIAYIEDIDGNLHLYFCHTNTREVSSLMISVNSPIADSIRCVDPSVPDGEIIRFTCDWLPTPK